MNNIAKWITLFLISIYCFAILLSKHLNLTTPLWWALSKNKSQTVYNPKNIYKQLKTFLASNKRIVSNVTLFFFSNVSRGKLENYWPLKLTPVLHRLVATRISACMERYHLLGKAQHGFCQHCFCKGKSCLIHLVWNFLKVSASTWVRGIREIQSAETSERLSTIFCQRLLRRRSNHVIRSLQGLKCG